jgi:hypothetical protein
LPDLYSGCTEKINHSQETQLKGQSPLKMFLAQLRPPFSRIQRAPTLASVRCHQLALPLVTPELAAAACLEGLLVLMVLLPHDRLQNWTSMSKDRLG